MNRASLLFMLAVGALALAMVVFVIGQNSDRDVSAGPPPSPTPTKQPAPGDTDGDGCSDVAENGPDASQGGQRDYRNFWDYFDVSFPKDGRIDLFNDVLGVILRYRTDDNGGAAPINRNSDPLATPPPSGYHPAFDRSYVGPNDWNLGPPDDGMIRADDILAVVLQYNPIGCSP